jgi:hypothetical protein
MDGRSWLDREPDVLSLDAQGLGHEHPERGLGAPAR